MTAEKEIRRWRTEGRESLLPTNLHPVLRRVYAARSLTCADDLERSLPGLPSPSGLPGTEQAAELLEQQLRAGGTILVVGDYDADGATSCALAVRALRSMGAGRVEFLVPDRFRFGYGLTPAIVAEALKRGPDLLVTVDNGISSVEGVRASLDAGVPVLVTDHHLPGDGLPEAAAIVNPKVGEHGFAGSNLAGVGVIFYVMVALRSRLRASGWFAERGIPEPNLAELLDLVALGTVADLVALDRVNRILVHQGVQRIRGGRACPGIRALIRVAGRNEAMLVGGDLGFSVGPRLNAAGRLEDMSLGIECLLSDDPLHAGELAQRLDQLNRERQRIEREMRDQALAGLEEWVPEEDGELPFGLCLYRDDWHQGVIGILASRIKERYHRPVIACAPGEKGEIKGSARSVPGLHIRDALDAVATRHPGLLIRFGGHAMAAGLTLRQGDFERFAAAFDEEVRRHLGAEDLRGVILSDGELAESDLTLELAELLRDAGPWGQGFPEPLFDGRFRVTDRRIVGERHLKLRLVSEGGGRRSVDAIAFSQADDAKALTGDRVEAAYRLDVNEYRDQRNLQLVIEHIRTVSE